jgi:hypothetical protein
MNRCRVAILLLSCALAACASDANLAPAEEERGGGAGQASAASDQETAESAADPIVIEDPGERGPEAAFAHGIDLATPTLADRSDPAPKLSKDPSWPQHGAGASLGADQQLSVAVDEPERPWSDLNIVDQRPNAALRASSPDVTAAAQALTLSATTVHTQPLGIGGLPHEPTLSLGRSHMVIATRAAISIVSKGNRLLYRDTANNFFAALSPRAEGMFDCRAVYAPSQQRHVYMCLQNWLPSGGDCTLDKSLNCTGQILFAVSKDAYPTRPSDFYMWNSPNSNTDNNTLTRNDGDYPFLGVTNDMLVVSKLMRVGLLGSRGEQTTNWYWIDDVRIFSLADLAAGAGWNTLRQWSWWGDSFSHNGERVVGVVPAIHWDTSGRSYMVSRRPGVANGMLLWSISNPFTSSRSLTVQPVTLWQNQAAPCGANQVPATAVWFCTEGQPDNNIFDGIAPSRVISHHDGRFYTPTYRNNQLWWVRDQAAVIDGAWKGVVRFGVLNTSTLAVRADNNLFLSGHGHGYGGITATSTNDSVIGFVRSGNSVYPHVRAGVLDRNLVWSNSISVRNSAFPFVWGPNTPYDVGVSLAAEPSEDAAWLVGQYPDRAPTFQNDWNAGLVIAKMGGVRKADMTVPAYGGFAQSGITELATANRGAFFGVTVTVENYGDGPAAVAPVNLYLSTDRTITTADTLVGTGSLPLFGVAGGAQALVPILGFVPATMATGTYYLGAMIGTQTEYDTVNNNIANDTTTRIL